MNAECSICSEALDESTPISDAPCGHVYHSHCLSSWINHSKTCPQCRSRVKLSDTRKLFFNFITPDRKNSDSEDAVINLLTQLSSKDLELATCKEERDDTLAFMIDAEERTSYLEKELIKLQRENSELRLKAQHNSKLLQNLGLNSDQINEVPTPSYECLRTVSSFSNNSRVSNILRLFEDRTNV